MTGSKKYLTSSFISAFLLCGAASAADYVYPAPPAVGESDARVMAATYAAARYAERVCRMDNVKVNYAFFRSWLDARGGKTPELSRLMRDEIAAAKERIAIDIATQGADDWCWDYTSAVFENYEAPNGPIFYRDELGIWTSPEVQQDFLQNGDGDGIF
jgi:hypothetical protein